MSVTRSLESTLLGPANKLVVEAVFDLGLPSADDGRHFLLEALACRLAGTDVAELWRHDSRDVDMTDRRTLESWVDRLSDAVTRLPYHSAIALCTLAQPHLLQADKRATGAYYTDFRLARLVASRVSGRLREGATVVDASSGTGVLLVACAVEACGDDRTRLNAFLSSQVFAGDIAANALRGARLAMISLLSDLSFVDALDQHLRQADSLDGGPTAWHDLAPLGFDTVVGNPPWEKLTLTRHEYLKANGNERHYGAGYDSVAEQPFGEAKEKLRSRADHLSRQYSRAAGGELDLYRAFLDLALDLVKTDGRVSMLLPAGLIRSRNCASLRRALLSRGGSLSLSIAENRSRFFAIDSRFKFLVLDWCGAARSSSQVRVETLEADDRAVRSRSFTTLGRREIGRMSVGLGVPEVRDDAERSVLRRMLAAGSSMADQGSLWHAPIFRELDMSRNRGLFKPSSEGPSLALVEGRMVHQYRSNAKAYQSGTGRRALWTPSALAEATIQPQYWVSQRDLPRAIVDRVCIPRVGFCDITGQTNERSLLAARIPAGVVCGNKVPTILFREREFARGDLADLWLGIVNSLPFDWFVRRVITTTVNFFILSSIPLPSIEPGSLLGRRMIAAVRKLHRTDMPSNHDTLWTRGQLRAELDLLVLKAYGLDGLGLETILRDFPLLDRGQPPIPGEARSTVTKDVLMRGLLRESSRESDYGLRVEMAKRVGAVPYVPAEYVGLDCASDTSLPEEMECGS